MGLIIIGRGGFNLAHLSLSRALCLQHNEFGFAWEKFKVFIGDHGAMMIGFFLACSFIFLTQDPLNIYEQTVRPKHFGVLD